MPSERSSASETDMSPRCFISIIMPALNEEDHIAAAVTDTLRAFDALGLEAELIVVNDGSTDRTAEICADLMKGDENDPWETLRYCNLLEHVDIVIPFVFNRQVRPIHRNMLSFVYRFIINTTFLVNLNYTNGTVIYRKSILEQLPFRSEGFFYQTDILIRTVKRGYLFAEVPYRLRTRKSGDSKAVSFPSFLRVVQGYVRLIKDIYHKKHGVRGEFAQGTQSAARHGYAMDK